jgi:hypothetical protein
LGHHSNRLPPKQFRAIPYAVCIAKPSDAHARLRKKSYAKFRPLSPAPAWHNFRVRRPNRRVNCVDSAGVGHRPGAILLDDPSPSAGPSVPRPKPTSAHRVSWPGPKHSTPMSGLAASLLYDSEAAPWQAVAPYRKPLAFMSSVSVIGKPSPSPAFSHHAGASKASDRRNQQGSARPV